MYKQTHTLLGNPIWKEISIFMYITPNPSVDLI